MPDEHVPGSPPPAPAGGPPADPTALCDCNSGVTAGHCCGFDPKTAPPPEPPDLAAKIAAAEAALRRADHAEAARVEI